MNNISVLLALLLLSSTAGQSSRDIDLTSCRVQLSCGTDTGTTLDGSNTVQARAGKRGPAGSRGPPGPIGLKGSKGEPCDCESQLLALNNKINDLAKQACPQTAFIFPNQNQITDWIRVKTPIEEFTKASVCAWITSSKSSSSETSVLSYANSVYDNAFLLFFNGGRLYVYIGDESQGTELSITTRTHVCVVISITDGYAKVFRNGEMHARLSYSSRLPIQGGGSLVIGQEQDVILGSFAADQALSGTIENLMLWYRTLDDREVRSLYNDKCSCPAGYSIALTTDMIQLEGQVRSLNVNGC